MYRRTNESHDDWDLDTVNDMSNDTLSGFLSVEIITARRHGTRLQIDPLSHWNPSPASVSDATLLNVAGSLLEFSSEALVNVPAARRHVILTASNDERGYTLRSRDSATTTCSRSPNACSATPSAARKAR